MARDYSNSIGVRFGKLVVLEASPKKGKNKMVAALCDCGLRTTVSLNNLRNGHTKSCGCHKKIVLANGTTRTHGKSKSRGYGVYRDMRTRCENPNYKEFHLYGGRGITVCDRWKQGYELFLYDMGERPEGLTLERINVDEGYSPENCKWATIAEQANNKRNSVFIEYAGKRQTVAQWSKELDILDKTIYFRLSRGYSPTQALAKIIHHEQE